MQSVMFEGQVKRKERETGRKGGREGKEEREGRKRKERRKMEGGRGTS